MQKHQHNTSKYNLAVYKGKVGLDGKFSTIRSINNNNNNKKTTATILMKN